MYIPKLVDCFRSVLCLVPHSSFACTQVAKAELNKFKRKSEKKLKKYLEIYIIIYNFAFRKVGRPGRVIFIGTMKGSNDLTIN